MVNLDCLNLEKLIETVPLFPHVTVTSLALPFFKYLNVGCSDENTHQLAFYYGFVLTPGGALSCGITI